MSSDDIIELALSRATFENDTEDVQEEDQTEYQQSGEWAADGLDANRFIAQCNGTITDQTIPVIQEVFSQIPAEKLPTLEEMEQRLYAMVDAPGYRDTLAQHLYLNNQGRVPLEFVKQQVASLTAEEIVSSATNLYRIGVSSQGHK